MCCLFARLVFLRGLGVLVFVSPSLTGAVLFFFFFLCFCFVYNGTSI